MQKHEFIDKDIKVVLERNENDVKVSIFQNNTLVDKVIMYSKTNACQNHAKQQEEDEKCL